MMLGWVRDGILVVGMESEMRVYSQWNALPGDEGAYVGENSPEKTDGSSGSPHWGLKTLTVPSMLQLTISPSHSVLDLTKKGKDVATRKPVRKPAQVPHQPAKDDKSVNVVDIVKDEGNQNFCF